MARKGTARAKAHSKKPTRKAPKRRKTTRAATSVINPKLLTYYRSLAINKPQSLEQGARAIAALLRVDPDNPWANAEEAHRIVNEWRNGTDVADLPAMFREAHGFARRAIAVGSTHPDQRARPYGFWAEAFVYKYEREPNLSARSYVRAALYNRNKFLQQAGRRRRALMVEILESQVYWAAAQELNGVVELIEQEIADSGPSGEREVWFQWVRCFALHLAQRFGESDRVFRTELANADRDVSLIAAANYARLNDETNRRTQRDRFLHKPGGGNLTWNSAKEDLRSPFDDAWVRRFWSQSVDLALAPDH